MAKLDLPLEENIDKLIDQSIDEYDVGNYKQAINLLKDAWGMLPEPKVNYDISFHIVKYIIDSYLIANEAENALKWSALLFICDLERIDSGEREFTAGKVAFELNDTNKAKAFFYIANVKSEGRMFEDEDPKYLKILKG